MNPIYIFDQATQNRRNWCKLEESGATPVPQDLENDETSQLAPQGGAGRVVPYDSVFVCVIHFTRLNFGDSTTMKWATKYPNARFIAISGAALQPPENLPANLLYYRSAVGQELGISAFRGRFIEWYRQWSTNSSLLWGPLDFDVTPLYALRLLCEAWLLAHANPTDGIALPQPVLDALGCSKGIPPLPIDFPLAVPATRGDWLAPFQTTKASRVAIQMPDRASQDAVHKFFAEFTNDSPSVAQVTVLFLALHTFANQNL